MPSKPMVLKNGSTHIATGNKMPKRGRKYRPARSTSDIIVCVAKAADLVREAILANNGRVSLGRICESCQITPQQFKDYFKDKQDVLNYEPGCVPKRRWGFDPRDPKFMDAFRVLPAAVKKTKRTKLVTGKQSSAVRVLSEEEEALIVALRNVQNR